MKLAMAQMRMSNDINENQKKTLTFCDQAAGSDLLFFPEVQLSPFFAQYEDSDVSSYLLPFENSYVSQIQKKAKEHSLFISPNMYLKGKTLETAALPFDTSLWITPEGITEDASTMVHVFQAPQFYEVNYYTPSTDGFKVFDTPFGKVGIVICFDRHIPNSVQTCAAKGADLVIIPTANCKDEPMDLFEAEVRTAAMQNQVFIAMCNRVGLEGNMDFAGESIVVDPYGNVIIKADDTEQLVTAEIDLTESRRAKEKKPFLALRRSDMYM